MSNWVRYALVAWDVGKLLLGGSRTGPRPHTHIWQRWVHDATGRVVHLDYDVCALCGIRK